MTDEPGTAGPSSWAMRGPTPHRALSRFRRLAAAGSAARRCTPS